MVKLYGILAMPGRIFCQILGISINKQSLTRFKRRDYKRNNPQFHLSEM